MCLMIIDNSAPMAWGSCSCSTGMHTQLIYLICASAWIYSLKLSVTLFWSVSAEDGLEEQTDAKSENFHLWISSAAMAVAFLNVKEKKKALGSILCPFSAPQYHSSLMKKPNVTVPLWMRDEQTNLDIITFTKTWS